MSRQKLSYKKLCKLNKRGEVLKNLPLSEYVTFKCGGNADFLVKINTLEAFLYVIAYLQEGNFEYFILGAGSNTLVSDKGYNGVVLKLEGDLARIEYTGEDSLECGAGVRLGRLYSELQSRGLSGLECGAGIPASVGGAVVMNAGAYGFQMADIVEYVVAFVNGKITYFTCEECQFAYRDSVFQHNDAIILRIGMKFVVDDKDKIQERFLETMKKRSGSQPLNYPSAGCVFKRIDGIVISKMLDECGLKGLTLGDAQVSFKHANFIINLGNASSQDIYDLIEIVKYRFEKKTGIRLSTEIKFLGEFDEITR